MFVGFTKVDRAFTEPRHCGLFIPTTGVPGVCHHCRAEDSWSCRVSAGGGFLQMLSGGPLRRRKRSYYLGRFGEGKEFLRDGKTVFESVREGIRNQNNFIIQDTESFISAPVVSLVL